MISEGWVWWMATRMMAQVPQSTASSTGATCPADRVINEDGKPRFGRIPNVLSDHGMSPQRFAASNSLLAAERFRPRSRVGRIRGGPRPLDKLMVTRQSPLDNL